MSTKATTRRAGGAILGAALALTSACGGEQVEPLTTTVSTELGAVEGQALESGVLKFAGIPFAAPPVGDLRWRPPQPAAAWEGQPATPRSSPPPAGSPCPRPAPSTTPATSSAARTAFT